LIIILVTANSILQRVMLELPAVVDVFVSRAWFKLPWVRPADIEAAHIASAFGSHGVLGHGVPRKTRDLAALAENSNAARIFLLHIEVIVDFSTVRSLLISAPAHSGTFNRITFEHPVGHIDVMDVLLHDVIATQPGEHVPVRHLI